MKWSIPVAQVAGIVIYLHWTFLLLILWMIGIHVGSGASLADAAEGVGFVLAVFACIALHELGHALAALQFGVPTRDITILPIGGVARLESMPEDPRKEIWVAIAGPLVNLVIGLTLLGVIVGLDRFGSWEELTRPGGRFLEKLMWINFGLLAFNLTPAFPMDGGRVLRAMLAYRMPYVPATQWAAAVGQALAIGFGLLGLFASHWVLLFIALFVYIGAEQEAQEVQTRFLIRGYPIRDAMMTRFASLSPTDTLAVAVKELLDSAQQDFPVLRAGRLLGMLSRAALLRALAEKGLMANVGEAMDEHCPTVAPHQMLEAAEQIMLEQGRHALPVLADDRLVGLLTREQFTEWLLVRAALTHWPARAAGPREQAAS